MCEADLFYANLCYEIKTQMKRRYIKQKEMASILGMNISTFAAKLNGTQLYGKFTIYEIKKIADELLMSVDDLIQGA